MKAIKKCILFSFLFIAAQISFGQDFNVPKDVKLDKESDYAKYEKDIINCINWLENSQLDKEKDKRKEANAFLVKWISGSPDVSIEISSYVMTLTEKNPDFLVLFMGGWTKFVLENKKESKDALKGNLAGVNSIVKVYKADKGIQKDKNVEKLVKLSNSELEKWVKDELKKDKK